MWIHTMCLSLEQCHSSQVLPKPNHKRHIHTEYVQKKIVSKFSKHLFRITLYVLYLLICQIHTVAETSAQRHIFGKMYHLYSGRMI